MCMTTNRTMDILSDMDELIVIYPDDFENFPHLTDQLVMLGLRIPGSRVYEAGWNSRATYICIAVDDAQDYPQIYSAMKDFSQRFQAQRDRLEFYEEYDERIGPDAGDGDADDESIEPTVIDISEYPGYDDAIQRQDEHDCEIGDGDAGANLDNSQDDE